MGRMSSYRFRYTKAGPCNVSGTRSAYPTFTRVANIRSPGTPKIGASPQRPDTERMSSHRFRYTPASPCNASGTRSACPTTTRVASIYLKDIYLKTKEAHVKMATIEWQKPSTKGNLQKHTSKPLKIRKQKLALHCSQSKSLTLLPQNRCTELVVDCNKYKYKARTT